MRAQQIAIAYLLDGVLVTATRSYDLDMLIAEIAPSMDDSYGAGNWLCRLASELPADFSVDTYTIKDGLLVPASAELLASREAAAITAHNATQRSLREAEYRALTDPQVIELITDTTPEIKALKDQIREKYPYQQCPQ